MKKYLNVRLLGLLFATVIFMSYQNCGTQVAFKSPSSNGAASTLINQTGQLTVGASGTNPPLDLFFVVDSSASMLGHQINLGSAFSSIFTANQAALSHFNTNVYVFSTASTVNPSFINQIPTRSPSSISSVPAAIDTANLVSVPGSIFSIWNNSSGAYGTAPFSAAFNPASVLNADSTGVSAALFLAKQGTQTSQQYQNNINTLTQEFQSKLAYLNPTSQLSYENTTDVSSGLCSVARILKHSNGFISAGDSAAFVLVSDDNDRLNDRNPNNNQCLDSVVGSNEIVNGTCGHYQTNFQYDSTASVNYQNDTKFTYQSGTQINYSYPSGESCHIQYNNGYNYSYTYTAIQTSVTYTKCNQTADGTCISQSPNTTVTVAGDFAGSGNSCTQSMSALVSNPAPGTTFTCAANDLANQQGASGVDSASNGAGCSTALLTQLEGQANRTNINCKVSTLSSTSTTVANQSVGACANYCANNKTQYPACTLTQTTTNTSNGSFSVAVAGAGCSSQCPSSGTCGTGSISSYVSSLHNNAICGTPTALLSTITVNAGANTNGTALTCSNSLSNLTVTNSSNATVCSGQSNIQSCISSLQTGTPTSPCAVSGGDTTNLTAAVDVGCSTACSNSSGLCSGSATVASYLAQSKNGLCKSTTNSGPKSLSLVFNPALGSSGGCSTLCSQTISGSCDGNGWGATNGSTVSDYVKSLNGDICSSQTANISDTASFAAPASATASACTTSKSPVFFASDSAHPASQVTNYVAGDANHSASDFNSFIQSQSDAVLGAQNKPAVAVIGHLSSDSSLYGTDVSTDYINLAQSMGSNQVSSITGNYSVALGQISNFIVQNTQNSFALPIASGDTVYSVSVMHQGSTTWTTLNSSLWTLSGTTLSLNASANVVTGDQLMYQYHN